MGEHYFQKIYSLFPTEKTHIQNSRRVSAVRPGSFKPGPTAKTFELVSFPLETGCSFC